MVGSEVGFRVGPTSGVQLRIGRISFVRRRLISVEFVKESVSIQPLCKGMVNVWCTTLYMALIARHATYRLPVLYEMGIL